MRSFPPLGLVANGLVMVGNHQDAAHGAHDSNDRCIMYWAYEGSGILDALSRGLFGDVPNLGFPYLFPRILE